MEIKPAASPAPRVIEEQKPRVRVEATEEPKAKEVQEPAPDPEPTTGKINLTA